MEEGVCAMLIKQIHSELEKNGNNALRSDDLTVSQISALMELDKAEGKQAELKHLEDALHIAKSTPVGIVKRLEQKGFVEILGSPMDKRIRVIHMTPLGEDCCCKARENMRNEERKLTSALTDTERDILIALLQKVRASF